MMKKNEVITLTIEAITGQGSGVGRYGGMTVFVQNAALADVLEVLIIKVKKTYAVGKIVKLIEKSKDRIEVDCPVFLKCGGCSYRHISYESELSIKEQNVIDAITRIGKIDTKISKITPSKNRERYRNKGQYPIEVSKDGQVVTGFYAPLSHRVIDSGDCLLAPKEFAAVIEVIKNFIQNKGISVYDESVHKGLCRHIFLRRFEKTEEMMVCLVINGNHLPHSEELVSKLTERFKDIKSILLNINQADTNVVLGDRNILLFGQNDIKDELCGLNFKISPFSFYQVNSRQTERLYRKAAEYADLKSDDILLDLYCGVGTIGLTMAKNCKKLYGVEIVEEAALNAEVNAIENQIENAQFFCGDAGEMAKELQKENIHPTVVVVDPPRKGCSAEVINIISESFCPERVVYISCDPATLARDLKLFEEQGYWTVEVSPFDMFPRTTHVETVVLLSHKKPDSYINVKVEFGEGEGKIAIGKIAKKSEKEKLSERVTYKKIKEYIEEKYGFKVHTANIAEVKRSLGLPMYDAPNAVEELKHPYKTTIPKRVEAIKDALKHFKIIE